MNASEDEAKVLYEEWTKEVGGQHEPWQMLTTERKWAWRRVAGKDADERIEAAIRYRLGIRAHRGLLKGQWFLPWMCLRMMRLVRNSDDIPF